MLLKVSRNMGLVVYRPKTTLLSVSKTSFRVKQNNKWSQPWFPVRKGTKDQISLILYLFNIFFSVKIPALRSGIVHEECSAAILVEQC